MSYCYIVLIYYIYINDCIHEHMLFLNSLYIKLEKKEKVERFIRFLIARSCIKFAVASRRRKNRKSAKSKIYDHFHYNVLDTLFITADSFELLVQNRCLRMI